MTSFTSVNNSVFSSSVTYGNGVMFAGEQANGSQVFVTYKDYGTIVTVYDPAGNNHITVEYEAFSMHDIATAEYLARCVISSIKFSDRKVGQLVKNIHSTNNYTPNRIVHFSKVKQEARELFNALN